MTSPIRVRFAPSPTGYLHVGGARTALFNWLYARHHGGTFILRIEDTDRERSTKESENEILNAMKWLGLNWDEGPIYQSSRFDLYRQYAEKLVAKGLARRERDPEKGGGEAIIFKMPSRKIVFEDMIYGRIEFDSELIKDQVLIKSDGHPAYNFACVVDDADMRINPVLRGEDHLSNTPKQIALYEALELPVPRFAHVPLILGQDKSRLSKRHGATSVSSYKQDGYLPQALVNYLVLLGWSPGNDQEIFLLEDLIKAFDIDKISRKGAVFSLEKLQWMNAHYLRQLPPADLTAAVKPFLVESGIPEAAASNGKLEAVARLLQERMHLLKDIVTLGSCFFQDVVFDEAAAKKNLLKRENAPMLAKLKELLAAVEPFETPGIEKATRSVIEQFQVKNTPLMQAARVAVTGRSVSAGLFETMALLGKETCVQRLGQAVEKIHRELGE